MTRTNVEAFDAVTGHLNGVMGGTGFTSNAIAVSPDRQRVYATYAGNVTVIKRRPSARA
jgi:DNA-binding beta-propeller fold protein YncE